jgi:hypothetical protein
MVQLEISKQLEKLEIMVSCPSTICNGSSHESRITDANSCKDPRSKFQVVPSAKSTVCKLRFAMGE